MSHRVAAAAVLAALALVAPRPGRAATWEIDPTHSSIQFSVRHMMVSNVRGEFGKFAGTVAADEANPTAARVEATIETPSMLGRAAAQGPEGMKNFVARQPLGRLGTADEIAALAVYLASDESSFTTGGAHVADGGWTL